VARLCSAGTASGDTVCSESCRALRLQYVDLVVSINTLGHHFQHLFYKCTVTSRMQICRKGLQIKLTLSVCAEYIYSAASHASCPDIVLILCDFHKVLKLTGMGDRKC
jgi:hypothetical protein